MEVINKPIEELIPYARNPRKNDQAVDSVAASIKEFGFKQPIVIDADNVVVAGHTRLKAAHKLGLMTVPCVVASDLTPAQVKAYRLLDNKVAEKAEWEPELLMLELNELDLDFTQFDVEWAVFEPVPDNPTEGARRLDDDPSWLVIIQCHSETEQQDLFERFTLEGLSCKIIT